MPVLAMESNESGKKVKTSTHSGKKVRRETATVCMWIKKPSFYF